MPSCQSLGWYQMWWSHVQLLVAWTEWYRLSEFWTVLFWWMRKYMRRWSKYDILYTNLPSFNSHLGPVVVKCKKLISNVKFKMSGYSNRTLNIFQFILNKVFVNLFQFIWIRFNFKFQIQENAQLPIPWVMPNVVELCPTAGRLDITIPIVPILDYVVLTDAQILA